MVGLSGVAACAPGQAAQTGPDAGGAPDASDVETAPGTDAGSPPDVPATTDVPVQDAGAACVGFDAGATADYSVGSFRVFTPPNVIVARDAGGWYAFTRTCTHLGCSVPAPTGGVITCPCHGSRFNANGDVTGGPAASSLAHFVVTIAGGRVCVDNTRVQSNRAARVAP
jgi:Rieske Fe-S protein